MKHPSRLTMAAFRIALRLGAPSLDDREREEAAGTFRVLAGEAREDGWITYFRFLALEVRSVWTTAWEERRRAETASAGVEIRPGDPVRGRGPAGLGSRAADIFRQDLRFAIRNLARSPGFVTVSVLSLTFGISVSTGLFSVVNAVLLRPLPNTEAPEELVRIFSTTGRSERGPISYPDFEDLRRLSTTLEDLATMRDQNIILGSAAEGTRRSWGMEVSENYFQLMGTTMVRGRGFLPEDIASGGRVAIIGFHLWQEMFEGDPDILGRTVKLNGHLHTIVGVGPEGMVGLKGPALVEVAVPRMEERDVRGHASSTAVGRIKAGVTPQQVQAEMDALAVHFQAEHPDHWPSGGVEARGLKVMTLREALLPPGPAANLVAAGLLAVVGLILLITCSNVANLLLTRALKRREEVAIRSAVGASGRRILVQLLTENLLLFAVAGALSAFLIQWLAALASASGPVLPGGQMNVEVDGRVVGFVMAVVLATGLTFGLIPAFQASRPNLVRALKGREAPPRFRFLGIRNLLVGAQVGGSLFLVLVSLLLAQSLSHARRLDLGFEDRGVAVLELDLSFRDYTEARGQAFFEELLDRAAALPGVTSTALASGIPLRGTSTYLAGIEPEGYEPAPDEWVAAGSNVITPGYMELMGIQVLRGRGVNPEDRSDGEPILLVSQAFVDRYWPGEAGPGKTVRSGADVPYRVAGVVEDIPWRMPGERPDPFLWIPFEQSYEARMVLHSRTDGDPAALLQPLRSLVAEMDPDLPIVRLERLETLTANATQVHRILSGVLGVAGGVTLLLAMLGIYGIVAFSVSQRTREIGLRVAVGAEPRQVVRMVLREGMTLALVGLVPGILLSVVVALLMREALMGFEPLHPLVFGGGVGLLLLSVAGASWIPAKRAARCDPMRALRED